MVVKFRFQDLDIWKDAIRIADQLLDIADLLENRKLFRFAEQLRGAVMSVSNNIAEGSGSSFNKEFSNYLNMARRSVFETANIVLLLSGRKLIETKTTENVLSELDCLSRKMMSFKKSLLKSNADDL